MLALGSIVQDLLTTYNTESWPAALKDNLPILSNEELKYASVLIELGQSHIFDKWDKPGTNDEDKHKFFGQVKDLNQGYIGGLAAYVENAKKLLKSAADGENPLQGWRPEVPTGVTLDPVTPDYEEYERKGLSEVGSCGFVLVAGGLGERLGYNGIKVELPTQTITNICYLEHYCRQILTMQKKYTVDGQKLPLAIMVSDDTHDKTIDLLKKNKYFGLDPAQITILKQGKVPALTSNSAEIAMAGTYCIDAKPHGHGDVHSLMYQSGTASKWQDSGVKWVVFFQDTNALAFVTLPAMLGVSVSLELEVNSLTVPRVAKQAVGAITKLVHEDGRTMTVNVEYNQLDPLLRATGSPDGDVNDKTTKKSIYPGNINQLIFQMDSYLWTLDRTDGIMPEFVNPKYADAAKTTFKKPTRLECMMQDYPKLLGPEAKVGFTTAPEWLCFSPCKNNATDAAAACASGVPAGSAYTAESDQYFVFAELLRKMGAQIPSAPAKPVLGIPAVPGPQIIISPESAIFPCEIENVFPSPEKVQLTPRSTLVVYGDVVIRSLRLDGALDVEAEPGSFVVVRAGGDNSSIIRNAGYEMKVLSPAELSSASEVTKMRGYSFVKKEVKELKVVGEAKASEKGVDSDNAAKAEEPRDEDMALFDGSAHSPSILKTGPISRRMGQVMVSGLTTLAMPMTSLMSLMKGNIHGGLPVTEFVWDGKELIHMADYAPPDDEDDSIFEGADSAKAKKEAQAKAAAAYRPPSASPKGRSEDVVVLANGETARMLDLKSSDGREGAGCCAPCFPAPFTGAGGAGAGAASAEEADDAADDVEGFQDSIHDVHFGHATPSKDAKGTDDDKAADAEGDSVLGFIPMPSISISMPNVFEMMGLQSQPQETQDQPDPHHSHHDHEGRPEEHH